MAKGREEQHNAGKSILAFLIVVVTICVLEIDTAFWGTRPSVRLLSLLNNGVPPSFPTFPNPTYDRKVDTEVDTTHSKKVKLLLDMWSSSSYLKETSEISEEELNRVPRPPHLDNCKQQSKDFSRLDSRSGDEKPSWTLWKGNLGIGLGKDLPPEDNTEELLLNKTGLLQGPFPPWIEGGDEDNLPMTRRVQRDIWLQQHPKNCRDQSLKFLYVNLSTDPGWGVGAQLNAISGMFAVAMNENRIFVLDYFNRADHDGCSGLARSRWSCYFIPETSRECRERAIELAASEEAVKNRTITNGNSYWGGITWFTPYPDHWGAPWENLQPTSQVDGKLTVKHKQMKIWWWRAQAIRYLTRYPSEYLCMLLNKERHKSFGEEAAALVLKILPVSWPEVQPFPRNVTEVETFIWSNPKHRPWVPRPLLSVHVRQGDKGREMKLFQFKSYMELAANLRGRFPNVQNIWLSTEMQNVVDESRNYTNWKFYFTNITRQTGSTTMRDYENGLGRLASSSNSFVNLMMAVDCDFFVGALGSSWGSVIDGLRSTSGKAYAGILSVNPGQFW